MTGPKRELPSLNIRITADPSAALKGFKQVADEAKAMGKSIQDSFKATEKAQKESLKRQAANAKREVQNFLNLGSGQGKGFGKTTGLGKAVLAQARKNQSAIKKAASMDMDALVKRGMEGTKRLKLAAIKENAIMRKADQERARQVEQSRKAIQKQTEALVNDEERVLRRSRIRRRNQLRREKAEIEATAKAQEEARARTNAWLEKEVKAGAKIQRQQAEAAHKESRRQSRNFWQRRKGYILAIRQSRAEAAAAAAATHADRRRASKKFWQHKKNYILALRQSKAEQEAAAAAAHAESRRQSKQFWQRRKNYILALRQAQAERDAIAKTAKEEEHAIRRRSRLREISRLKDLRDSRQKAVSQAKDLFSGSGGSMMGARADIFMHQGALQNIVSTATNFLTPFAQVENATIQMRAYAGSAENAKKVVEEMQQFAIQSPYKLEGVLEATSMMMKYGQSAENAMELTRMLGDVAAGNTDKLRLLGLAVGQATGFGRLQGQELRQMVNAGFNPLKTAARELAGGKGVATDEQIEKQMDFLLTAMRKRQLDSDIIKAALEIETSKGGDFVGITAEQAKSLTGWANQFLETLDLIKIQITEAFAPELKAALELVVRYTTAVVGWMKANKELVKQYTVLAVKILAAVVAFHVLGAALATAKWLIGSLLLILAPLKAAIQGIIVVVNLLRTGMVTAWIAAIGPIGWLIIAIGGIGLAIAAVRHQNGFWGLAKDAASAFGYLLGFMYNFAHNLAGIFDFISNNWGLMIIDGLLSPLHLIYDPIMWLAELIANVFGTSIPDSVANLTQNLRTEMARIAGIRAEYDTSMFKFDGPKMGDFLDLESYKKALEPFMPPDPNSLIKDKPDIDFKKFIMGAESEAADPAKLREHAILGSADHAMRMYQYGQDQAAMMGMEAKKNPNAKMEDLLSRIERNTRGSTSPLDNSIEEAALV